MAVGQDRAVAVLDDLPVDQAVLAVLAEDLGKQAVGLGNPVVVLDSPEL